ncbi:TIGR02530 family flagellar biosynthesis protein [Tepidibacillus infernus]|uniref:Flagellar biosynthesis protein n=1 Tax=Tepidibacillus decaturensis TaxID=1413211 RepID=A0A135L334_9BACI|nr:MULTISPECIES: TIGR02530 family flagellar biosynthesis protein [Tepidibacillus]KXG43392.1 hypothetical protein U473_04710 [Tepidibacillus decaturensis]GBF11606.1 hypothetical protein HK1_01644 [Tepidibacillus sp. HK-1]
MSQSFNIGQSYFPKYPLQTTKTVSKKHNITNFNTILSDKLDQANQGVKFSAHAQQRLTSRGIQLDIKSIDQLNEAVQKAAQKGAKDSLILLQDLAFIVNIPNRVVVTTIDQTSMKEHIFTNIDSAIIL